MSARLGLLEWWQLGQIDQAAERMERSFQILSKEVPDADVATLASDLGRLHFFAGRTELSMERVEFALPLAEGLELPDVLSHALNTKALLMMGEGRRHEADALLKKALEVALEHDQVQAALRAYVNLSVLAGVERDQYEEALGYERDGLSLARKFGDRGMQTFLMAHQVSMYWLMGRWDEALEVTGEILNPREAPDAMAAAQVAGWVRMLILIDRGQVEEAFSQWWLFESLEDSGDVQLGTLLAGVKAARARAAGRHREAMELAMEGVNRTTHLSFGHANMRALIAEALVAAIEIRDREVVEDLLRRVSDRQPGSLAPFIHGLAARARAQLAWWEGEADAGARASRAAEATFRQIGNPYWLGVTLLERAEWLASQGSEDEARSAFDEAREIFERLRATPWVERAARVGPVAVEAAR